MKLSIENGSVTFDSKPYTMEMEDEIDRLKSTISALRRNAAEDNCYILALEEIIENAKACFHVWESPWDMYEILMGADIKKNGKFTS